MALHLKVNHKRTERVMRLYGIKAPRRKHHYFCTVSTYNHHYTNLIADIPKDTFVPHLIWVCDVSYFKFQGQFWYLATIEDLATRQILSSHVGKYHDAALIIAVIKDALLVAGCVPTYFHSDQGTEFMAKVVTDYLELHGVQVSVSAKASPWQNGYKESFFGHFKDEVEYKTCKTFSEVYAMIETYMEYYNCGRRQWNKQKMTPIQYRDHLLSLR